MFVGDSPHTLSELANKISISKPEISRHLSRLTKVGIVTKEHSTRKYKPSALGETYIQLFSPIEFVLKNSSYFKKHTIDLPLNLLRNVDALMNAEFMMEPGRILFKVQEMLDVTVNEVQLMIDQRFPVSLNKKIKFGDYIVPRTMTEQQFESGKAYMNEVYEKVEIRLLNNVTHIIMYTDRKRGFLSFPTLQGKADWASGWIVTDKLGLNYLQDIWDYFKNSAKKIET
jgi:predicted transcriptional regulator